MSSLSDEEKKRGVVTSSSGNHGQAVACAATMLDVRSVIVMPEDAPKLKIAATEGYGAEVVLCGHFSHERRSKAEELARTRSLIHIDDVSDPKIITGHGTIGIDILQELPDTDAIVCPCGSGGLISGIAAAVKQINPSVRVLGATPAGAPTMYRAIKEGRPVTLEKVDTIADGLRATRTYPLPFGLVKEYVDDIFLVEDREIIDSLILLLERAKLLVEPSGAVSLAAVLAGKIRIRDKKVIVLLSGGNTDLAKVADMIGKDYRP